MNTPAGFAMVSFSVRPHKSHLNIRQKKDALAKHPQRGQGRLYAYPKKTILRV